jgi:hypothetical protein
MADQANAVTDQARLHRLRRQAIRERDARFWLAWREAQRKSGDLARMVATRG